MDCKLRMLLKESATLRERHRMAEYIPHILHLRSGRTKKAVMHCDDRFSNRVDSRRGIDGLMAGLYGSRNRVLDWEDGTIHFAFRKRRGDVAKLPFGNRLYVPAP